MTMKDIAIFGAGGFGKEVACLVGAINRARGDNNQWNFIGFFDDSIEAGTSISHFGKVLGGIETVNSWDKPLDLVIAIGSGAILKKLSNIITNSNINFPNLIHPSVDILDLESFKIGKGNIIQRNCTGSCDVILGDFNVLNSSVQLGHDNVLGSFNVLMPAVRISGAVTIGDGNFFGVGSIVLQQIKIGNNVRLGAGSVIMTNPKDEHLYMGNPARKIQL